MASVEYTGVFYNNKLIAASNIDPLFQPAYVYKYMEYKYAIELLEHGKLRLTELHHYQSAEHAADIKDDHEGRKKVIQQNVNETFTPDNIQNNPIAPDLFKLGANSRLRLIAKGISTIKTFGKSFAFCCSEAGNDWSMAERMDPKYDTCLKIEIIPFISKISLYLKKKHMNFLLKADHFPIFPMTRFLKVEYKGHEEEYKPGQEYIPSDSDALKREHYQYQKELRALWSCNENVDVHCFVKHKKLTQHIQLIGRRT